MRRIHSSQAPRFCILVTAPASLPKAVANEAILKGGLFEVKCSRIDSSQGDGLHAKVEGSGCGCAAWKACSSCRLFLLLHCGLQFGRGLRMDSKHRLRICTNVMARVLNA